MKALESAKPEVYKIVDADIAAYETADPPSGNAVAAAGPGADDLALALAFANSSRLRLELADYARATASALKPRDAYERSGRVVNLLIKDSLLRRAARDAHLVSTGASYDALHADAELAALAKDGTEINYYVNGKNGGLYDQRNFPAFPAGDAYLGADQYFAMGDNRYNSTDFRYESESYSLKALDPADPSSVLYYSNIDPFALDLRYIEGYALFRLWPLSRLGPIQ